MNIFTIIVALVYWAIPIFGVITSFVSISNEYYAWGILLILMMGVGIACKNLGRTLQISALTHERFGRKTTYNYRMTSDLCFLVRRIMQGTTLVFSSVYYVIEYDYIFAFKILLILSIIAATILVSGAILSTVRHAGDAEEDIYEKYHETKEIESEVLRADAKQYIDDVRESTGKMRYEIEELEDEMFDDDSPEYIEKKYYDTGELWTETPYVDYEQHGIEKAYYKTGELRSETPYYEGVREGVAKKYYRTGELESETPYADDVEHGIDKAYRKNGKLMEETPYDEGVVHGTVRCYDKEGRLLAEVYYENDEAIKGFTYREGGKLMFEVIYKDGRVISGTCHRTDGTKVPLTTAEVTNWNNGLSVTCP